MTTNIANCIWRGGKNILLLWLLQRLNQALTDCRVSFKQDKANILKEHKAEVKAWKKDLGEARRNQINLEKKLFTLQSSDQSHVVKEKNLIPSPSPNKDIKKNVVNSTELSKSEEICSMCGSHIYNYIPEYFYGEKFNPACGHCKEDSSDPFSSFPGPVMPHSLVSHWIPPTTFPKINLESIASLKSNHVLVPNPGDTFVSMKEVLEEIRREWAEERKAMRADCKQS